MHQAKHDPRGVCVPSFLASPILHIVLPRISLMAKKKGSNSQANLPFVVRLSNLGEALCLQGVALAQRNPSGTGSCLSSK